MSPFSALDPWLAGLTLSRDVVTLLGAVAFVALLGLSVFFSSADIAPFSPARHRATAAGSAPGTSATV